MHNITSNTHLYCLIGNPVNHSLSPVMHNTTFDYFGYDAIYFACNVNNIESAVNGVRGLDIKGCSITFPYKISVMKYLDHIDMDAIKIGAVNTIINKNGDLLGHNFDCAGAMAALLEKSEIEGKTVVILGAGGAGRAIGYGIKKHGGYLKIINRTESNGRCLASDLGAVFCSFYDLSKMKVDIIINTTSVGMIPYIDTMPIPKTFLNSSMTVMDIVYNPIETVLLKTAKKLGCKTINGLTMLAYQGAFQFESWTNFKPSLTFMKKILLDCVKRNYDA